jgi:EmrB/QacA subfamily drug resistance transporter
MKIADADTEVQASSSGLSRHPGDRPQARDVMSDRRSMVFAAALSTIFMAAIEGTIVATAMPTIVGALGGLDLFSWIFGAYLLTQAVMIPIYGRLADVYGRKPILLFGIGVFLAGSVLCGLSWNMTSLIVFRIVQGIGAGSLVPLSQTVVGDIYSGEQRARMQGYISSAFGSAAILGPLIGGFLANHVSWKAIFWVNIPLGIIAAVMLQIALKENIQKRPHRIDYVGAALMATATGVLMFALVHGESLSSAAMAGAIAACIGLSLALWAYERRISEPLLPFELYRNRIIAGGNAIGLANGVIMMSIVGFLPAYMQAVMGSSTLVAGTALGAMSAAWPFGGFVGSRIVLRTSYRIAAMIGAVVLVAGSLLLITLHIGATAAQPITAALLVGFGMGVTNICFVIAIQADVDWSQRGAAISSVSFSRIIGQSLGSAVFGGILNVGLSGHAGQSGSEILRILRSGDRQGAEAAGLHSVIEALSTSLHNIYLVSGVLALAVLIAVLTLPPGLKLVE